MKIIYILLITLFSLPTNAQESPFIGVWEHDNGSQIFRVFIKDDTNGGIDGDYELIEKSTGAIIYQSRQELNYGLVLENSIYGSAGDVSLSAGIDDRTFYHPGYGVLGGDVVMVLQNTSPYQTATWEVRRRQGIRLSDDDRVFNIPTDLILTKIEDNPVLDD